MKEHPIIFSTDMVKAILDGRKTQTRRIIKPQPPATYYSPIAATGIFTKSTWAFHKPNQGSIPHIIECPYGQVGDRFWVREAFMFKKGADARESFINTPQECCLGEPPHYRYKTDPDAEEYGRHYKWRPSIFMPRWASRITLEITGIRVERLRDITSSDIKAEGFDIGEEYHLGGIAGGTLLINKFAEYWDSINGKKYPWSSNPWVWVIEFKKV